MFQSVSRLFRKSWQPFPLLCTLCHAHGNERSAFYCRLYRKCSLGLSGIIARRNEYYFLSFLFIDFISNFFYIHFVRNLMITAFFFYRCQSASTFQHYSFFFLSYVYSPPPFLFTVHFCSVIFFTITLYPFLTCHLCCNLSHIPFIS